MKKPECKICGTTNENKFYSSIKTYCKEHWREKVKANRDKNIDYYRKKERERAHFPNRIAARNPTNNGKIGLYCVIPKGHPARDDSASSNDLYRLRNPKKYYATSQVAYALKTGKLKKKPCEVCGDKKSHGHHEDYNKPLDVIWLCNKHHKERHEEIGRIL